jgi:3-oxoacyl-[acyl-carrier protein] reductase
MVDMQARSVRGSVAFVTGVASGMGAATAKLFAAEGAHVAAVDRDAAGLDAVLAEIAAAGGSAHGWLTDIGDQAAVNATVAAAAAHFGGLDIIVNNAGIAGFSPIDAEGYDDLWERILRINLSAHQWVVRAALPWLRRSKAPRIVNIASTEALGATAYDSAYVAAKAGVTGLTRALAVDLGPEGITCNCICPGPIDTGMTANVEADKKLIFAKRRTALKRYGAPIEVAQMTLSLCLPAASYITGAVIPVDGGLVARNA